MVDECDVGGLNAKHVAVCDIQNVVLVCDAQACGAARWHALYRSLRLCHEDFSLPSSPPFLLVVLLLAFLAYL